MLVSSLLDAVSRPGYFSCGANPTKSKTMLHLAIEIQDQQIRWTDFDLDGPIWISLDLVGFRLTPHDLEMRALGTPVPKLVTMVWVHSARPS